MSFSTRLSELGIELPEVAAPLASYIPAKRSGNYVCTSGQLPLVGGELIASGKVGPEVDEATAQECARVCILNALAAVAAVVGGLDNIRSIVSLVGSEMCIRDRVRRARPLVLGATYGHQRCE